MHDDSRMSLHGLPLCSPAAAARRTDPVTSHATAMLAGGVRADRSTEDKEAWCRAAESSEREFVTGRLFDLGIAGWINLEKKNNKYAHDLNLNVRCDLKEITTPFFMAAELFGLEAQYAVSVNCKDMTRYRSIYPGIIVIFDVCWQDNLKMERGSMTYTVNAMRQTHVGFLDDIRRAVQKAGNKKHEYKNRRGDTDGNAKDSWVFDVRELQEMK